MQDNEFCGPYFRIKDSRTLFKRSYCCLDSDVRQLLNWCLLCSGPSPLQCRLSVSFHPRFLFVWKRALVRLCCWRWQWRRRLRSRDILMKWWRDCRSRDLMKQRDFRPRELLKWWRDSGSRYACVTQSIPIPCMSCHGFPRSHRTNLRVLDTVLLRESKINYLGVVRIGIRIGRGDIHTESKSPFLMCSQTVTVARPLTGTHTSVLWYLFIMNNSDVLTTSWCRTGRSARWRGR